MLQDHARNVLNDELIGPIEVTRSSTDQIIYRFPRRDLGNTRMVAWLLVILMVAAISLILGLVASSFLRQGIHVGTVMQTGFQLVLIILICRYPLWFVVCLLFGRREVGLKADQLQSGDSIGPLRWNSRWLISQIKRLQIVDIATALPAGFASAQGLRQLDILMGSLANGKRIIVVPGYPQSMLAPFAASLLAQISNRVTAKATEADREQTEQSFVEGLPAIDQDASFNHSTVAVTSSNDKAINPIELAPTISFSTILSSIRLAIKNQDEPDLNEQPSGSQIQIEQLTDGISIHVPPPGLKNSAGSFYRFGQIWTAFVAMITMIGLIVVLANPPNAANAVFIVPFVGLFWIVGVLMIRHGRKMASRETGIAVLDGQLVVLQSTFGKIKRWERSLRDVSTIRCGPSGTEINDVPVYELQIMGTQGKLLGLLSELDRQELRWVATILRKSITNLPGTLHDNPSKPEVAAEPNPALSSNEAEGVERLPI